MRLALEQSATAGELPSEFRIFTAGKVVTEKGTFTFDASAAKAVMAAYREHGNEIMIDYDHASLSATDARDPAMAGKAAGWCALELRDGELWAVNVRWTDPAAAAMRAREWRYMSPAFAIEKNKITSLLNVALTNIPATRNLTPLVAASRGSKMSKKYRVKLGGKRYLIKLDDGDGGGDVSLDDGDGADVAADDGDGADVSLDDGDGSADVTAAILSDPDTVSQLAAALGLDAGASIPDVLAAMKAAIKSFTDAVSGDSAGKAPPPMGDMSASRIASARDAVAVRANILRTTGKDNAVDALEEIHAWRDSHVSLSKQRAAVEAERRALEAAELHRVTVEIVKANVFPPSVAWEDSSQKPEALKPSALMSQIGIVELKKLAGKMKAAPARDVSLEAPASGSSATSSEELSAFEVALCNRTAKSSGRALADVKAEYIATRAAIAITNTTSKGA